jgi:hypothetical protein
MYLLPNFSSTKCLHKDSTYVDQSQNPNIQDMEVSRNERMCLRSWGR